MWRQNPFWETEGSDQSISDNEEDGNHNLAENPRNPFQGRNGKDNVEMPVFLTLEEQFLSPKKLHGRLSDEELISDDEENNSPSNLSFVSKAVKPQENHSYESTSKNVDEASTWSAVFEETKELMCLHENDSSSSSHFANYAAKKNWKGSGGKAKPKFLFRLYSDKEELSSLSTTRGKNDKPSKVPLALEGLEDFDCGHTENSMAELLEGLQKSKEKQPDSYQVSYVTSSGRNRNMEHPMAEILDGLLENIGPLEGTFKMNNKIKGKRLNVSSKRNIPSLGCRTLDTGEPFEPLDSSTSSEEEVVNFLNSGCKTLLKPATSKAEGQMMADRFHKALDAAAVNDHRTPFATSRQTG